MAVSTEKAALALKTWTGEILGSYLVGASAAPPHVFVVFVNFYLSIPEHFAVTDLDGLIPNPYLPFIHDYLPVSTCHSRM